VGLLTNSYGDTGEVATLTPRYANTSKLFDAATRPTLLEVESWCDQVSAIINGMLSEEGFSIPMTQTDAVLILDFFVNSEVAAIVEGVNGGGRFAPGSKATSAKGRWALIYDDVKAYIEGQKKGFQVLGESVSDDIADNIATRGTDEAGDDTFPINQRKAFGGDYFTDWDKD
jgi:hypothetical protein